MILKDRNYNYNLYEVDKNRYILEVAADKINYYDKTDNIWKPIDPNLIIQADETITTNNTSYNISIFPDRNGYRIYPDKTKPDIYIDFYLPEYLYKDKQVVVEGNEITYLGDGYKTSIITTNNRIIFQLEVDNEEVFKIIPKTLTLNMKPYGTILEDNGFFSNINVKLINTITDAIGDNRTLKYSYDKNTNILSIYIDTAGLTYPIIIDPTVEIDPGAGGNDGYVSSLHTNYSIARSTASSSQDTTIYSYVGQFYSSYSYIYSVMRSFIKFDTSSIPSNATISYAKLRLYGYQNFSNTDFIIRLQKWTGDTPITTGDFNSYDGINYDDGNFNTSSFTTYGYNDIIISNYNLITKGGYTKICIRSSRDINSNIPRGDEDISYYTYEQGSSYYPILYIEYTTAAPVKGRILHLDKGPHPRSRIGFIPSLRKNFG